MANTATTKPQPVCINGHVEVYMYAVGMDVDVNTHTHVYVHLHTNIYADNRPPKPPDTPLYHHHTNALQQSDALPHAPHQWHQSPIIQRNENNNGQGIEQGKGGCWNLKALGDTAVHLCALLNEECIHLDVYCPVCESR